MWLIRTECEFCECFFSCMSMRRDCSIFSLNSCSFLLDFVMRSSYRRNLILILCIAKYGTTCLAIEADGSFSHPKSHKEPDGNGNALTRLTLMNT